MTQRRRLPNRRSCTTFDFESQGLKFTASFSRFSDGSVSEIFIRNHKATSMSGINASDAAVLFSIAPPVRRAARCAAQGIDARIKRQGIGTVGGGARPDCGFVAMTAAAESRRPAESAVPVDLLAASIERVRPAISDRRKSTKQRVRILWAAAKAARDLGAWDRALGSFGALAVQTELIDHRGRWTGADIRPSVRPYGLEDVDHVIAWALRGWNPFEKGPLT